MYRPIPELQRLSISSRARQRTRTSLIFLGEGEMTYLAPVTMATRPCKSSRSFPGEMFDAELPICTTAERKGGGFVSKVRTKIYSEAFGFYGPGRLLGSEPEISRSTIEPMYFIPLASELRTEYHTDDGDGSQGTHHPTSRDPRSCESDVELTRWLMSLGRCQLFPAFGMVLNIMHHPRGYGIPRIRRAINANMDRNQIGYD